MLNSRNFWEKHHAGQVLGIMDVTPHDPSWLKTVWTIVSALGTAFMGLLLWNVKRHIASDDALAVRVSELEKDRVKKGDIAYIADRLSDMDKRLGAQHAQILDTIIDALGKK